jgi:xanthine dehydrogenase FAD-binding subunit
VDLNTVESLRPARHRSELVLAPGEQFLGGGTWLFSEPQVGVTGLVDLTTLGWAPWRESREGLSIAGTCTIAELVSRAEGSDWTAAPLFRACAEAFLMSSKIWSTATVGGNLALALPAGAMISLSTALGAEALIWGPEGNERRQPVADLVTGVNRTTLAPGELVRSIEVAASALQSRTAFRKTALTSLGRSSSVVIGVLDPAGRLRLSVTAATSRPYVFSFAPGTSVDTVLTELDSIDDWYADPHGAADWRAAVTRVIAGEVCEELL